MKFGIFLGSFLLSSFCFASNWSQTNIQFLHGDTYRKADGSDTVGSVMTVEHLSHWDYGSNFFFFDISNPETESSTSYYGEFSPSLSMRKLDLYKEGSYVKDISFQLNFELPQGPAKRANLAGLTFEWKNVGFDYLATQFLYRDTMGVEGNTGQLTLVWIKRFGSERAPFEFSGFLDWAGKEGYLSRNIHTQINLLYDIDRKTAQRVPLKLGVEYKHWDNKFGIDGLNERVPQVKLQWNF